MLNLESLMKKRGLSQEKLAHAVGVTQGAVSQWVIGIAKPASDKLPKLAKVLGCSIDELYGREAE